MLLQAVLGADAVRPLPREPCRCRTKSAVVPARGLATWRDMLARSPFGAGAVVSHCRYLGATLASPAPFDFLGPERPLQAATRVARDGTWQSAMNKILDRSGALQAHRGSPVQRAVLWNVYVASLTTFPALLALPSQDMQVKLLAALRGPIAPRGGGRCGP